MDVKEMSKIIGQLTYDLRSNMTSVTRFVRMEREEHPTLTDGQFLDRYLEYKRLALQAVDNILKCLNENEKLREVEKEYVSDKGELTMIKKFYFPLTVSVYGRDEDGYWENDAVEYDGEYADEYRSDIEKGFDGYNDDDMVDYFDEGDSETAKAKLQSMIWGFESVNSCLYGTVTVTFSEELTNEETEAVKDYICGQNSDGLGEGFEQQPIRINDEEIYVSFWHGGNDYWIYDEDEFDIKIRKKN